MALSKELEDMLALLPAEDQTVLRPQLEKHEPLRAGFLRQADYDRNLAKVKSDEKVAKEAQDRAAETIKKNQDWFAKNEPIVVQAKKERDDMFKKAQDLEAKVTELTKNAGGAAAGAGAVDQQTIVDAVMARVGSVKNLTEEQVNNLIQQEAKKLTDQYLNQTLPAAMEYTMSVNEIMMKHKDEFNEPFDRAAFHKFTTEHGMTAEPPMKVYDEMVREKRDKAKEARIIAETEKRIRSEQSVPGSGTAASNLPGTVANADSDGAVVQFLKTSGPAMGTGMSAVSAAAAAELRAEGKS